MEKRCVFFWVAFVSRRGVRNITADLQTLCTVRVALPRIQTRWRSAAVWIRGALVLARVRVPRTVFHLACPLHGLRATTAPTDRGLDMDCSRV